MKNARPQKTESSALDKCNSNPLLEMVKAGLLVGRNVRLIDYPPESRSAVIDAIEILRDDLPICCRWITVRESHLSETRLRARAYRIPSSFLQEGRP